ncbi:hypothetical protein LPJ66_005142 [Kickxella alabastrina]|uniref:Uncharacterized protein n=1 Tax=Kickxella alabastrina TaxID=61397 RepID=A0ACC1ILF1_9FUNG|nr:hypothetical protein LPJ66_005142 [Kickxella alabastrina]
MVSDNAQLLEQATELLLRYWVRALTSLVLVAVAYLWTKRGYQAPYAPSDIFVPSTSTYPSKVYTSRSKISVSQFVNDFLHGRIELRDAHSGRGMEHIAQVVSFRFDLTLAWRIFRTFMSTSHTEYQDKRNVEKYVTTSDSLLEQVLGPDRLPLVGYFRDEVPEELENSLAVQMERIGKEYLDLNPNDRLLDVNSQWGDLAVYLAHDYQVPTCAIVATSSQLNHATNLSGESQVQRFLRFVTGDYRAVTQCLPAGLPPFTKVLAIDALDTIGTRNIPAFLRSVNEVMESGGRFMLQVTTTPSSLGYKPNRRAFSGHQQSIMGDSDNNRAEDGDGFKIQGEEEWSEHWWYHWFRQRYIQPGADTSMLISVEQVMGELQRAGFEVIQMESLTTDAATTTAVWCNRLCAAKRQIEMELGEDAYRAWELYLNWTQSLYARGRLHKHFILAMKRA